jgi:hypothetical protein
VNQQIGSYHRVFTSWISADGCSKLGKRGYQRGMEQNIRVKYKRFPKRGNDQAKHGLIILSYYIIPRALIGVKRCFYSD